MKKYELNKCQKDIEDMPKSCWHNGMVYEIENLEPKIIATFDNINDALNELKKYKCEAKYLGGISKVTRATEYWVELNEYDEEDEYVQTIECYNGIYAEVERIEDKKEKNKRLYQALVKIKQKIDKFEIEMIMFKNEEQYSVNEDYINQIEEEIEKLNNSTDIIEENIQALYWVE